MDEIDFFQAVEDFRPTESYFTTFCFDPVFYESALLPKLQRAGSQRNAVFVDAGQFNIAVERNQFSSDFKAGKEYFLFPVITASAFHPKIYFFKKIKKGLTELLCLIGSGNLTLPGLTKNKEIFTVLDEDDPECFVEVFQYFEKLFAVQKGESARFARSWFENCLPSATVPAKRSLLVNPSNESIFVQLSKGISEKSVDKIFLTAPFYDENLYALTEIVKRFQPRELVILIQPDKVSLPLELFKKWCQKQTGLKLLKCEVSPNRYLHAKMMVLTTSKKEYLFSGSANISRAALFGTSTFGNYEACVLQTGPLGFFSRSLEISRLGKPLKLSDLKVNSIEIPEREGASGEPFLLSASARGPFYEFIVNTVMKNKTAIVEYRTSDNLIKGIELKSSSEVLNFKDAGSELKDAVLVRLKAKKSGGWLPVLRLEELALSARASRGKADSERERYLNAYTDESSDYFLNLMIDYLIHQSLHYEMSTSASQHSARMDKNDSQGYSVVEKSLSAVSSSAANDIDGQGFINSMDYLFRAVKAKQTAEKVTKVEVSSDETETETNEEGDETELFLRQKIEDQREELDFSDVRIARLLRSHRRKISGLAMEGIIFKDAFSFLCFFLMIALPQMKYLGKVLIGPNGKKAFVENEEWENFINSFIGDFGSKFIQGDMPAIKINSIHEKLFECCIAGLLHVISSVFIFMKRGSESFGLGDDAGAGFARLMLVLSGLIRSLPGTMEVKKQTLSEALREAAGMFPCTLLNAGKYQNLMIDSVAQFIEALNTGGVILNSYKVSKLQKEIVVSLRGKPINIWSRGEVRV